MECWLQWEHVVRKLWRVRWYHVVTLETQIIPQSDTNTVTLINPAMMYKCHSESTILMFHHIQLWTCSWSTRPVLERNGLGRYKFFKGSWIIHSMYGTRLKLLVEFVENFTSTVIWLLLFLLVAVNGKSEGSKPRETARRNRQREDSLIIGAYKGLCSVISSWNLHLCRKRNSNTCFSKGTKPAIYTSSVSRNREEGRVSYCKQWGLRVCYFQLR